MIEVNYEVRPKAFGAWLIEQASRGDWIGALAKVAKTDPAFPRGGDIEAVRARLQATGADGDAFEALDAAELDYLAL